MSFFAAVTIAAAAALQDPRTPGSRPKPPEWSFSASTFSYFVPGDRNFTGGVATADRGWLHLEARYNYEDLRTGSFFAGWNWSAGKDVEIEATLMAGAVAGETEAIAPAWTVTLRWKSIEAYVEGEYLVDLEDASDNFLYGWSELSARPVPWLRFGVAAERTRVLASEAELNVGALVGIEVARFEVTVYLFDADLDRPVTVLSLKCGF